MRTQGQTQRPVQLWPLHDKDVFLDWRFDVVITNQSWKEENFSARKNWLFKPQMKNRESTVAWLKHQTALLRTKPTRLLSACEGDQKHKQRERRTKSNDVRTNVSVCSQERGCASSQRYQCQSDMHSPVCICVCVRGVCLVVCACRWMLSMHSFSRCLNQQEPCDWKQKSLLSLLHFVQGNHTRAHARTQAHTSCSNYDNMQKHSNRLCLTTEMLF